MAHRVGRPWGSATAFMIAIILLIHSIVIILWSSASLKEKVLSYSTSNDKQPQQLDVVVDARIKRNESLTRLGDEHNTEDLFTLQSLSKPSKFGANDLCNKLRGIALHSSPKNLVPTGSSVWKHFKDTILESSMDLELEQVMGNKEKKQMIESWSNWLFDEVSTPGRMGNSIVMQKERHGAFSFLKSVLQKKLSVHGAGDARTSEDADPLRILILGGSVPAGTHCALNPFGLPQHDGPKLRYSCVWPARLGRLLNSILGNGVVDIRSMALGGTSSDMGALAVKFELWEHKPHIVLADYAANDFRPDATGNVNDVEKLALALEEHRNCTTGLPVLLYIDEFIAWPRNTVVQHFDMQYKLQQIADYHDFSLLSYSRAFRDFALADLEDTTLKGSWSPPDSHGGRSQHIIITWMVAYSMLQGAFDHCFVDEGLDHNQILPRNKATNENGHHFRPLPERPGGPKPALKKSLTFDQLSSEWNKSRCSEINGGECEFVWVANRIGGDRTARKKGDITAFLKPKLVANTGWKEGGDFDKNKHGWLTEKAEASFSLKWVVQNHDIKRITILSMKSYGEKWRDSTARLTVSRIANSSSIRSDSDKADASTFEWSGFHNSETSVSIPFSFDLPTAISKGETILADFELMGGSSFKISGMMFCED